MSTIATPSPAMPAAPIPNRSQEEIANAVTECDNLYIFYYRHGVNPGLQKIFFHKGTFATAKKRAEQHCGIMGYKFIWIRPFIVDLDVEEATQLSRS